LTKKVERRLLNETDGVVVLTERIWPEISKWAGLRDRDVVHEVVPCCADLEKFQFRAEQRMQVREKLGLKDQLLLVYSGSVGGWYLTERMADFFGFVTRERPDAHVLWLTPAGHELINELMRERHIGPERFSVIAARPSAVPAYLSAADAGVAFIKPCFSKLASSPTKYGEYLACGLPLIINSGVGDSDLLVTDHHAGALINQFDEANYRAALTEIERMVDDAESTRRHCRDISEKLFNLETIGAVRYARLYEHVCAVQSTVLLEATAKPH
jgi:glycosyltransferase involved in cell wall biosynthesis